MLEKLGLAKTHLELKKMMSEVTGGASSDTISYHDFLNMMLGKRNAILKLWVQLQATKKPCLLINIYYMFKFTWWVRKKDAFHLFNTVFNIMTCCLSHWRILMFEGMGKEQEPKDVGPPARKTFSDLPWMWPSKDITICKLGINCVNVWNRSHF